MLVLFRRVFFLLFSNKKQRFESQIHIFQSGMENFRAVLFAKLLKKTKGEGNGRAERAMVDSVPIIDFDEFSKKNRHVFPSRFTQPRFFYQLQQLPNDPFDSDGFLQE